MAEVVVVGSINMDVITRVERLPIPGETVTARASVTGPGGKGANQVVAAARLGVSAAMVGRVGTDTYGSELISNLMVQGVDVSGVLHTERISTGTAFITVDSLGMNTIVVVKGANGAVTPADVEAQSEVIRSCRILITQLEIPLESARVALELGRAAGAVTILNPAPGLRLESGMLGLADFVIPNESEAEILSGTRVVDERTAMNAARRIRSAGAKNVLITLGALGSLYVGTSAAAAEEGRYFPPFRVNSVDSTAAGDAFVAGFAVEYMHSHNVESAARFASAAGALATTVVGAQSSLPMAADVLCLAAIYR